MSRLTKQEKEILKEELPEGAIEALEKRIEYEEKLKEEQFNPSNEKEVFGLADYFVVIFDNKKVEWFIHKEYGGVTPTFKEVLDKAKENGYEKGELILIANAPQRGFMYRYNAYLDAYWEFYGETRGYV